MARSPSAPYNPEVAHQFAGEEALVEYWQVRRDDTPFIPTFAQIHIHRSTAVKICTVHADRDFAGCAKL
jgi:hypothetical protein